MTLLSRAEDAVDSIEVSAQAQADVISGGIDDFVSVPSGSIRSLANAINIISAINPTGAWVTATSFTVKDIVDEVGTLYICTIPHTSGVFATDLAANKWAIYNNTDIKYGDGVYTPVIGSETSSGNSGTYVNIFQEGVLIKNPSISKIRVLLTGGTSGAGTYDIRLTMQESGNFSGGWGNDKTKEITSQTITNPNNKEHEFNLGDMALLSDRFYRVIIEVLRSAPNTWSTWTTVTLQEN